MENFKTLRLFLHNSFCFTGLLLLPYLLLHPFNNNIASIDKDIIQDPDTIPPVANCIITISAIAIPIKGYVYIYAKDFDNGSYDNFTQPEKLEFYFDGNILQDSLKFHCYDLLGSDDYEKKFDLILIINDEAGNSSKCNVSVIIQDRLDICNLDLIRYAVRGEIRTTAGSLVKTKVTLTDTVNISSHTSEYYQFGGLKPGNFLLCLERNHDHLNGLGTSDILKIQRHILGIAELDSPYKLMAADVNQSGSITASDVVEIKKLILGIKSEFSKVPSWIFVPRKLTFSPRKVPDIKLFIPSCDSLEIIDKDIYNMDYFGIKMGDVDGNARGD